jgi:transcriptional regulator with XRE-family HTH domain
MASSRFGLCPLCGVRFPHSDRPGRRKRYCGPACRRKAQRHRDGRPAAAALGTEPLARPIAEDVQELAGRLLQAEYDGASLRQRLCAVWQMTEDLENYAAAAVADARLRSSASWREIADAAQCPTVTARNRWRLSEVEPRLARRAAARRRDRVPGQTRMAPPVMPRRTLADSGTTKDTGGPGPAAAPVGPPGPAQQLAGALSHLHRECDKTIRALATEAGVSPSYVSRVLSGERLPSWQVTSKVATACGADPVELRALWERARGIRVPDQAPTDAVLTLQAALRGLYLAAARPAPARLRDLSRGRLTTETVQALIRGTFLPDWDTVGRFVTALRGRPADIRPLWDAAQATTSSPSHEKPTVRRSPLLATHFG